MGIFESWLDNVRSFWQWLTDQDERYREFAYKLWPEPPDLVDKLIRLDPDWDSGRALLVHLVEAILVTAIISVGWILKHDIAPPSPASNSVWQQTVPTVEPSPTAIVFHDWWQDEDWLAPAEARALREQTGVVNLALLDQGGARYLRDKSVMVSPSIWQKSKPLGLTELTVRGTSVQFTLSGADYVLNVYQPFVTVRDQDRLLVVDETGAVWQADRKSVKLVSMEDVHKVLPVQVEPNPGLSYTF